MAQRTKSFLVTFFQKSTFLLLTLPAPADGGAHDFTLDA